MSNSFDTVCQYTQIGLYTDVSGGSFLWTEIYSVELKVCFGYVKKDYARPLKDEVYILGHIEPWSVYLCMYVCTYV